MLRVKYEKKVALVAEKVRNLCIRNYYYTAGTVDEYSAMFKMCSKFDGSDEELRKVATDIVTHTSAEDLEDLEDYGCESVYENIAFVMTQLAQNCIEITYSAVEYED